MNFKKHILAFIFVAFLSLLPLFFSSPVLLHALILIYFWAFLAMSWNIIGGFAGQLSMGHAAYVVIGAYVSTLLYLRWNISPWISMFGGGLAASMLSVIIGYPCFKLRGAYYALATLAFAELVRVLIANTDRFMGFQVNGPRGILLPVLGHAPAYFQFVNKVYYYYIILAFCAVLTILLLFIGKSRFGYYLTAIREDQEAAEAVGINVMWCKLFAGILSSFFTALGGVFYAQYVLFISAGSIGSIHISLEMVFISIVGGKGTLVGPIIGAFLLTPLGELTRVYLGGTYMGIHLVLYALVLILVVKFMPSGVIYPLNRLYSKIIKPQG